MEFELQNLTKTCNETLILAALSSGDKHGYQLAVELEEKSNGYFRFKHGTLYPILHKLEKDGLIRGEWADDSPKRKRKQYHLTARGARHLDRVRTEWQTFCRNLTAVTEGDR